MAGSTERGLLRKIVRLGIAVPQLGALSPVAIRIAAARRLARSGRRAAEDLLDDTAYRIRRAPLHSVAICFVIGLGLGALAGWRAASRD